MIHLGYQLSELEYLTRAEQVSWEMGFCECFEWNASWMVVAWPHGFQPGVEREWEKLSVQMNHH
jgi:hypothetical protein